MLYEDDDVLVINKPAGLVVHADRRTVEPTLVDWIVKNYPTIESVGEPIVLADGTAIARPGIVHRLDRETSGAMVIAKNPESFLYMKRQFADRQVHKIYRAFVYGELRDDRGIINRPIGRSANDFRQKSAGRGAKGVMREAITWFKVLKRKDGFSFIEAQPRTGRTHQIRVHFKAVNHPVVSDSLYAAKRAPALGFSRTALHSYKITFKGRGGKEISATAPYPADFEHAIKLLTSE